MPRRPTHGIRREIDARKIALGFAGPGNDTRSWVEYGTVASVGQGGEPAFDDPAAVLVTPAGVDVDVLLDPDGTPVTCEFGMQAGAASVLTPIRPGDRVAVLIPGGDLQSVPQITRILSSATATIPLEADGKPVFRNDRVSVFARGVPIELRTDGGAKVRLETDGTVVLDSGGAQVVVRPDGTVAIGAAGAAEQLVLGTTYRQAQTLESQALFNAFTAAAGVSLGTLAPLAPFFTAMAAAVHAFETGAAGYLSQAVKTE